MRRSIRLVLAAALVAAAFVPAVGVGANHTCSSDTVVFSSNSNVGTAINSNALVCIATAGDETIESVYDGRIINPGSDQITVRYIQDLGEGVPELTVTLNGLGFDGDTFSAAREQHVTGSWVYNTETISLDPTEQGDITATVSFEGTQIDEVTFHTVGS